MSIQSAIETLQTARAAHDKEIAGLMARIEDLSKQLVAQKGQTTFAQDLADQERKAKNAAVGKLDEARQMAVDTRAKAATQIATLEAEKELMAVRVRDARIELDRMRVTNT